MTASSKHATEALAVLQALGLPVDYCNDRTAYSLLALLDLTPRKSWPEAQNPLRGIRAILDFAREQLNIPYAENTRESVRKYSVKYLVEAGIVLHNPDDPARAVNSSKNVYQVEANALALLRRYGTSDWNAALTEYLEKRETLAKQYARDRDLKRIPVKMIDGLSLSLSPGEHSDLIRAVIEDFAGYFVPDSELVYVGDTGAKFGYFDEVLLKNIGVEIEHHGKMPDVVLFDRRRNWLVLVEAVTSSGPMDGIRHRELARIFQGSSAGLVYVTAFANRGRKFREFVSQVAWETEVWCASDPKHLIHFNGDRFLGPRTGHGNQ